MGLLNKVITTRSGNDLPVLNTVKHRDFPQSSSIAAQFIGMNDLRNVKFGQQSTEEGPSGLRTPVLLHEHVQLGTIFVHSSPEPVVGYGRMLGTAQPSCFLSSCAGLASCKAKLKSGQTFDVGPLPGIAILGAQWGDEGKGKITDFLTPDAHFVVRFQGGANAGYTVNAGGKTFKLNE